MVRSTLLYSAGLAVWTAAAVAAWEILQLVARWGYKDGRAYSSYLFNDVTGLLYAALAAATFATGALAFLATARSSRGRRRALLLTVLVPTGLLLAVALAVTVGNLLQAWENGSLADPLALLSLFPGMLAIAAVNIGVPCVLAAALWSWFFCAR